MKEDDLHISVQDNVLTLEGTRTLEPVDNGQRRYHYSERAAGTFCRRFQLSTAVDADQITATYKDGVLEVHLPKVPEAQPKRIAVQTAA
jgi:HSP20 family protein